MTSKDFLDRPADTPAYRRYLAAHPEAADLDAKQLAEHVFQNALSSLERIRQHLDDDPPTRPRSGKP